MSTATLPATDFHPRARGLDLDPAEFGFFTDSSSLVDDIPALHHRMEEDGYLYLRGFFDREDALAPRRIITDRLMAGGFLDDSYPAMEGVVADVKVVNARSAFSTSALNPNESARELKKYNPEDLTDDNQPLRDLLDKGRIMDFFTDYFGGPARRFNYTWFRAVGPGMGTPPHCDWVYMSRGTPNLLTTWVPIGDTPLNVGGLMILEGSHKKADRLQHYLSRDVDEYCTNSPNVRKLVSGELQFEWDGILTKNPYVLREKLGGRWLTADYAAGDLLIFTMRTIHASLDNQSNRIRISVDTRYQLASEPADERWISDNPVPYKPDFKKGRAC